jgi:hypothetical protein
MNFGSFEVDLTILGNRKGISLPNLATGPKLQCGLAPQCSHGLPGLGGIVALARLAWPGRAWVGPRGRAPSSLLALWRMAARTRP